MASQGLSDTAVDAAAGEIVLAIQNGIKAEQDKYAALIRKNLTESGFQNIREAHEASLQILLRQNALLETEIYRLCEQLHEATEGILKRGYLYMWRDRSISYASRWGLRYFVLQGSILSYFQVEGDKRPRKTIDLKECSIRSEGEKKNGQFHVFGVYLCDNKEKTILSDSGLILRLSTERYGDAKQWIDLLDRASKTGHTTSTSGTAEEISGLGLDVSMEESELSSLENVAAPTLERVKSTEMTLRKSMSLRQMNGSNPTSPVAGFGEGTRNRNHPESGKASDKAIESSLPKESNYQRLRRLFPASRPMHTKVSLSPLSSETRPNEQNYRGFFHLGVIVLIMTHLRIIFDNFLKYGWLLQLKFGGSPANVLLDNFRPVLLCLGSWAASILSSLLIEKLAARRILNIEAIIFAINFLLSTCNASLPCLWVWYYGSSPILSMIYLLQSVIIWMKLLSYAHTNRDLRLIRNQQKRTTNHPEEEDNNGKPMGNAFAEVSDLEMPILNYPRNISLGNLLYFCVVPTLCYQLNYPRSPYIRWKYVATILFRMIIVAALIIFFVEQYISPTLGKSMKVIDDLDTVGIFSLMLRLSVPNTYVWLLGFYFFFHLWLNLFAELTRFGDRLFYKDWWNARTVDKYWQRWNLPVHHWMIRHCYYPILRTGLGKSSALFLVFFLSALFHEVIISVPFKQITYHAFLGMLAQAPLTFVSAKLDKIFDNAMIGNVSFWMIFCIVGK